ncbi:ribonuclease H-like domain-containing protein [Mycena rosella]|uniref:Ribonuclease H-like domain-containing protein n=1 Tax=Mycena rosella TaxID=1033263 RepID=A0AAD7C305_MYCRO|nr:ribonuclease H-like domain-containing protein [Mycena rosella]
MSSWAKEYFQQGKQKYRNDQSHWESRCKACIAHRVRELNEADKAEVNTGVREYIRSATDLDTQAERDVPTVSGKSEHWLSHLSRCIHVAPDLQALTKATAKKENGPGPNLGLSCVQSAARAAVPSLPQPAAKISGPSWHLVTSLPTLVDATARMTLNIPHVLRDQQLPPTTRSHGVMWDLPQQEFAQDLCKLFVACNISWNSALNAQLNLFFSKYVPEAKIPDRQVLSGHVLDLLAAEAEAGMKSKVAGRFGTGQCDGWKTNAKAAVVTTSVTVDATLYINAAHNISPERKTSDNLLQIVLEDITYCEERGIIMVDCCTQVNLVVGEVLEIEIPCMLSVDEGLDIVKWFTNHSRAIGLLADQQKLTERFEKTHRILRLIFPVISQWIYYFLAVCRILIVSPPMRVLHLQHHKVLIECAGPKADARAKAEEILAPIDNPQFWKNLTEVKILLEPLAIAAKCMQAPDAGLDQVLLMLGNLYRIYGAPEINSHVRTCIRKSLKKCWLPMEQDVFILAVYLNPYIRCAAFSTKNPVVKPINLYQIAKRLFHKFFDVEPNLDFHEAFFNCSKDLREFSSQYMNLAEMKQLYQRENKCVSITKVWEQLDTGESNDRNRLVKLALWVLSIVANSAGSERGFSKFGLFLTKLRSQLSIQKVKKMTNVDMDLKRQHEELGLTTDRIKRKFVHFAEYLTTQLCDDLTNSRNAPIDEEDNGNDEEIPVIHSRSNYTLKELFQYPANGMESLENGLGFYWEGRVKDLQHEMELYDIMMEDMDS